MHGAVFKCFTNILALKGSRYATGGFFFFIYARQVQHSSSTRLQEVLESRFLQRFFHLEPCCMGLIFLHPFQNHSMASAKRNKSVTKVWCHVLVLDTAHDEAVLSLNRGSCLWCQELSSQVLWIHSSSVIISLRSVSFFRQSMWRTKRSTVDGYFLAGKNMTWWPVSQTTSDQTKSSLSLIS